MPPIRDPPWFPHQGSHGHQASSQAFGVTKFGMGKPHQKHRGQRQQCLRFLEKKRQNAWRNLEFQDDSLHVFFGEASM